MTDEMRRRLGELPVPEVNLTRRRAAIDAGLAAFTARVETHAADERHQGIGGEQRPREATKQRKPAFMTFAHPFNRWFQSAAAAAFLLVVSLSWLATLREPVPRSMTSPVAEQAVPPALPAPRQESALDQSLDAEAVVTGTLRQPESLATGAELLSRASTAAQAKFRADMAPADDSGDAFPELDHVGRRSVADAPVSTFSIDVDTAAYAYVRRLIRAGRRPPPEAVRIEEMINYFDYDYPPPTADEPFRATTTVMPTPWNDDTQLLHIGIRGQVIDADIRPAANLVFLVDASGSMRAPDKLGLLKQAMGMLLGTLQPDDTIALVAYAGAAGTVLPPTPVSEAARIRSALDGLRAGGSTAGAAGIRAAYDLARREFRDGGINRVILATDGDFNVGMSGPDELKRYIARERESGIYLSVLGFGRGNLNDALMQALAQNGNGNAAYIDTLSEARKVLVEEAGSMLFPIANDVKIQVEFNPARIAEYRLLGYETRALNRRDFNDDRVDAGEIGSGHTVTAIYEITPADSAVRTLDALRYGPNTTISASAAAVVHPDEFALVRLRYKRPGAQTSRLIEHPVTLEHQAASLAEANTDSRFAAAVGAFGLLLRNDPAVNAMSFEQVASLADQARGADPFGYRAEFLQLVRTASHQR